MIPIKEYEEKYNKAKYLYLEEHKTLTAIGKELHMNRSRLSKKFKTEGIEIIHPQNYTKFNDTIFESIDTEEKAYWLGFLYADGSISNTNNTIELSLKSSDINHLIKFKYFLGFEENKHIFQDDVRCRFQFSNKKVKQDLCILGCIPKKSLILTFPTTNQVPSAFMKDFIRGYIDGDGCLHIKPNESPYLSIAGTKEFLQGLLKVTNWKNNKIYNPPNTKIYTISWGGKYVLNYLDFIYEDANIFLDRKYEKYQLLKKLDCRSKE